MGRPVAVTVRASMAPLLLGFAVAALLFGSLPLGMSAPLAGAPSPPRPAPAHAPGVPAAAAFAASPPLRAPGPRSVSVPAAPPPIPPFDWDQMYFQVNPDQGVPSAGGAGAVLVADDPGQLAFMFGGYTVQHGLTNETYLLNQTTAIWHLLQPLAAPSPRTDFSMASGEGCGVAVLFGGLVNVTTGQDANDTWLFNYTTLNWTNISRPVAPAPRQGAALTVDTLTCTAVLFGGVNAHYRSGNSSGSVQWNDTWSLDLRTGIWTPLHPNNEPASLDDAGLLYDNISDQLLMFGGCENLCSNQLWELNLTTLNWTALPTPQGDVPSGRGGAVWTFSYTYDVALLFGGYELDGNTKVALNDTFVYEIAYHRYSEVGGVTPPPRYLAAGTWLAADGCPGLVVLGGGGAPTDPPDMWYMDPDPDIALACNTWGNDSISTGGGGGGSGCDLSYLLTVTVANAASGLPLLGAEVDADGNCSHAVKYTFYNGTVSFRLAYEPYEIWVNATGFHDDQAYYLPMAPAYNGTLFFSLIPLPNLLVETFVKYANATVDPLPFVTISIPGPEVLGITNTSGFLVESSYEPPGLTQTFLANRTGYSLAQTTSPIPFTGTWRVNLTLLAPGPIDVQVREAGSARALPGAEVTVEAVAGEPPNGFQMLTDNDGWANATVSAGNFTAKANLSGFEPVGVTPTFGHPWANTTVVFLNLTSSAGYVVDVHILDRATARGLRNASVQVGLYPVLTTNVGGWANQTGVKPAGTYEVVAWDANFTSNETSVRVSYFAPLWIVVLNLTPLQNCTGPGQGCQKVGIAPPSAQPLVLWPGGQPPPSLFFGGGVLLVLIPTLLVAYMRRRPPALASPGSPP